jgi:hypothetical protein
VTDTDNIRREPGERVSAGTTSGILLADSDFPHPDDRHWEGRLTDAEIALTEYAGDPDAIGFVCGNR